MKVRLLTDGGYGLRHDEMSKVYEAKKKNSSYIIIIDGIEMYFYADEVEVVQDYVLKTAEDKTALKYIVISIIATILCIAAIILVIF
jgi:outer membrane lipoprotein-sorting protein